MNDGFEATFRVSVDRAAAWQRLVEKQPWLPGWDATFDINEVDDGNRLAGVKLEEPCAGTDIVVTLEDDGTGTRIHVVQSGFGDWLTTMRDMLGIGWRHIVADIETYIETGANPRRHFRHWGNFGADLTFDAGAVRLSGVKPDGLAASLGMIDGDLLTVLAGAPISSVEDAVTILRAQGAGFIPELGAEWIRGDQRVESA